MLMLNIIQKRLTDDWLIDWSLPSSLIFFNINEEDVDCESKTLHNCCSIAGVSSGLSQNDAFGVLLDGSNYFVHPNHIPKN
jgi:hypothetical protein